MSAEEIIHAWKSELLGKQPAKVLYSTEEPENEPWQAPTNPTGEQELSDEDLELAEGGLLGGSQPCTVPYTCPDPQ